MNKVAKSRFGSAEAALRFYFRAREFLDATANGPLRIPHDSSAELPAGKGIFKDYTAVGSSLCHLDDFQIWLMCELYGPTCFHARHRTLERAVRTARSRFPGRPISRRDIERVRNSTVQMLRCRLVVMGLISVEGGACAAPVIVTGSRASARHGRAPMNQ
jgi:hypothetical protein